MKKLIIILVVVAIVAGAWFFWFRPVPVTAPGGVVEIGNNDTTPVITEELDSVAVPEIDAEFESINKDLNSL